MRGRTSSLWCPVTGDEVPVESNKEAATQLHRLADGLIVRYMGYIYITASLTVNGRVSDVNVYTEDGQHVGVMWNESEFDKIES